MKLFSVIMELNTDDVIQRILWLDDKLADMYEEIWAKYLGKPVSKLLTGIGNSAAGIGNSATGIGNSAAGSSDESAGTCSWESNVFIYNSISKPDGNRTLYLSPESEREFLMERALDLVNEGIQIYDENAQVVYINRTSREISEVPESLSLQGRHLLDIYNLDEDVSTSITALKTGNRVIDRVDHFYSNSGTYIATANSGYPVVRNGKTVGVVTFEQTRDLVDQHIERMKKVEKALRSYQRSDARNTRFTGYTFDDILGGSQKMQETIQLARRIARQDCSVLLVGETGTGKEMFAQSIHKASQRSKQKFLAINCAAVPSELIEGLLFGTAKGSFTGSEDRKGYFEEANGGTLFLDELNSMSLSMQSKILRALQEHRIRRVGGSQEIEIDVRFISSCNEDPFKVLEQNRLRKDLFYRLSTVMIDLPALREHPEDIPELIQHHIDSENLQFVNPIDGVSPDVLRMFQNYSWPGNIRELFHVIDYAMNVSDGGCIEASDLPKYMLDKFTAEARPQGFGAIDGTGLAGRSALAGGLGAAGIATGGDDQASQGDFVPQGLQETMDLYEEQVLRAALNHFGGNITQTAAALNIKRQSLQYRIRKYGIII